MSNQNNHADIDWRKKPTFFIVGAPKCGTTSMNEYLKAHPEIFIPARKEIHYFGKDMGFQRPNVPTMTPEYYMSHFEPAPEGALVGEASVWYLFSETAAQEIYEFEPNAKIIIMLRNPVDMLYSLHSQMLFTLNEDIEDFQQALDAEGDRRQGKRIPDTVRNPRGLVYRDTVKYASQVKRYFNTFGRKNVHVIIFDDFKNDTATVYAKTCKFLGVDDVFQPNFEIINPNTKLKSRSFAKFLKSPPKVFSKIYRAALPESARLRVRARFHRSNTNVAKRPPMDEKLRVSLKQELMPEAEALSELLGRDLTFWCKPDTEKKAL